MKLLLIGHDDRYAVEQLQLALFPLEPMENVTAPFEGDGAVSTLHRGATWLTATAKITKNGVTHTAVKRLRTADETDATEGIGATEETSAEGAGKAEAMDPVLIIFSTSEEQRQIDLSTADAAGDFTNLAAMLTVSEEPVTLENGVITLPPRGIAILTKQPN